jgi:hypothetical protein
MGISALGKQEKDLEQAQQYVNKSLRMERSLQRHEGNQSGA